MTPAVRRVLDNYASEPPGVLKHLAEMLNHGALGGTGKLVILPVDQGFEHGPGASFAVNPPAYDPVYLYQLAIEAGCNAFAAPLGLLRVGAREFAGEVPLILKANSGDLLFKDKNPCPAVTASVENALNLGCAGIGFTIYPGSSERNDMYEEIRELAAEARNAGLVVVVWSYPRGEGLSKEGETAIDVIGYAAQIACQLGAHLIKVKPPTAHLEVPNNQKALEANAVPIQTLMDRVRYVMQSAFAGKRVVIFSGGEKKDSDEDVLAEIRELAAGGAYGSIVGRNAFQRPWDEALALLGKIQEIYRQQAEAEAS